MDVERKKYFPALTGLRFVAASMVFFHHNNYKEKSGILFNITNELHIGVTIFFVLSGFLIAYRYCENDKLNIKQFFINRFARIYPVYFLLTTITFAIMFVQKIKITTLLKLYLCNITFLRGFSNEFKFSGVSTGWSLTVEEMFYCLSPFIFVLLRRKISYLILLPVLFLISGLLLGYVFTVVYPSRFFNGFLFILDFTFFGRSFEFFVGVFLALIVLRNNRTYQTNWITYFGFVMLVLSVMVLVIFEGKTWNHNRVWSILFNNYIIPFFSVLPILYGLIYENTVIRKILENRYVQLLGKSSYVFYLIHLGFIYVFLNNYLNNRFCQFILLNIISIFIYKFIEKPLNKYIRQRWGRT